MCRTSPSAASTTSTRIATPFSRPRAAGPAGQARYRGRLCRRAAGRGWPSCSRRTRGTSGSARCTGSTAWRSTCQPGIWDVMLGGRRLAPLRRRALRAGGGRARGRARAPGPREDLRQAARAEPCSASSTSSRADDRGRRRCGRDLDRRSAQAGRRALSRPRRCSRHASSAAPRSRSPRTRTCRSRRRRPRPGARARSRGRVRDGHGLRRPTGRQEPLGMSDLPRRHRRRRPRASATACPSCSAASSSTTRAGSPATPTAT